MTNVDRQQDGLETLKLMNAATTALRLYPEQSVKVTNAIEKAYQGVKAFLRKHELFRFSLQDGAALLQGEPVDKRTREHLKLLTVTEQLRKLELHELVLKKGFDRKIFKKMLSVFSATPEQVQKAGGGRGFIEQLGLTANFPEQFVPGREDEEEKKKRKERVERVLGRLSQGGVRREHILYLLGRKKGENVGAELQQIFQIPEQSIRIIAAATYSLLQRLQQEHIIVVSPVFSQMLEKVDSFLEEKQYAEIATKAASLLGPYLDEASLLMFVCQEFSPPFGDFFYNAQVNLIETTALKNLLKWMQEQQERGGGGNKKLIPQLKVLYGSHARLIATSRVKQLQARVATKEILEQTEQGRKGKRVQAGITALAKGEMSSLSHEEVRLNLPATIEKLLNNDKEPLAAAIIQNLVTSLKEKENMLRPFLAQSIGGVAARLATLERWDWLEKLTPVCLAWICEAEIADRSYENHVTALQAMMSHAWKSDNDELAERILNVFYHIRIGGLEKPEAIRTLVGRIQDKGVDLTILQSYLERCFVKPVDEMICRKISMQGPVAARFMLDALLASENRSDRIRLLKILSGVEKQLPPVLLERLPKPMPWFGKRNLVRLLAETGSEKDAEAVLEYITHEDLRVGQEALNCIVKIGGMSTQKYLLQILPLASIRFKTQAVKALKAWADNAIVVPLIELLEECELYRGLEKTMLVIEICNTLGVTGAASALPVLQKIVDHHDRRLGREGVNAATEAIALIHATARKKHGRRAHEQVQEQENQSDERQLPKTQVSAPHGGDGYECMTSHPEEKEVYVALEQDKKETAKRLLVELIEKTAKLRQFDDAEALRLRLIEIDSMALADIIKAAEFIEESKSSLIDHDHIIIWSDLYDLLSTEEFNTFYLELQHKNYSSETEIVRQGDTQWRLFFINKGRVKLFYREKENETLVKTLGPGQVFGGSSFFDSSVWTLGATSMGAVELSILPIGSMEKWGEVYPALEPKLQEFCMRFDQVSDFFEKSGFDRRQNLRLALSCSVATVLLDSKGEVTETTFKGEGSDISLGGVSFFSKISQRKHARMLLGRHVKISFSRTKQDVLETRASGIVVAVRSHHSPDLRRSIHICFDTPLGEEELQALIDEN
ncbi:MAG: cyclic nucleotide-binding domain-containing protein [Proteobacteria bacterium]|nr:cyclic nucleotide-binding domain-containing protein [Pseudomonadota bacterium]MBU1060830.1 cyclic nucleotide-binding domain-containing protein [Pseudomonadota bacterium]